MKYPTFRCAVIFALTCFLSLGVVPASMAAAPKRLLAYYTFWSKWNTPAYAADNIPYQKLTHIAHAFLLLDKKNFGNIVVPDGLLEPSLIANAHAAGVKVQISIGGGDPAQAHAFRKISADPALRAAFVQNVYKFVVANGYDGVDIDWEIPVKPRDTENCIMLMQDLRDQFPGPQYLLSMAIPSDPRSWGSGFDVPTLAPLLDFINVMTYDFYGPWSAHAGLNSPLYQDPADPEQVGSIETSMDLFAQIYGVPPDKLNMGTAFYGYEFDSAQRLWDACTDCGNTTFTVNYGTDIKPRIDQMGWVRHRDSVARSPFLLYQGAGGQPGFISYDDAQSTRAKANYVLGERGFGGVFMWSLDADYDGSSQDLLDALYSVVQHQKR
ncbi:MAG TPA: glycoside hydrolase family 18 protein [Terriglobales bacterium]|jgi:chitinase|nr:glycoside hydrolase family 18 protein [Terriglobales bacterium]